MYKVKFLLITNISLLKNIFWLTVTKKQSIHQTTLNAINCQGSCALFGWLKFPRQKFLFSDWLIKKRAGLQGGVGGITSCDLISSLKFSRQKFLFLDWLIQISPCLCSDKLIQKERGLKDEWWGYRKCRIAYLYWETCPSDRLLKARFRMKKAIISTIFPVLKCTILHFKDH